MLYNTTNQSLLETDRFFLHEYLYVRINLSIVQLQLLVKPEQETHQFAHTILC